MSKSLFEIIIPIITFFLGFITSRFTMSKKERKDHLSSLQRESNLLNEQRENKYQTFATSLHSYIIKQTSPDLDDFYKIATSGDAYFNHLRTICDTILSDNLDKQATINTHLPIIKEAIDRLLPTYYETLNSIAEKCNIEFSAQLKKDNYKSIYLVYEKYL